MHDDDRVQMRREEATEESSPETGPESRAVGSSESTGAAPEPASQSQPPAAMRQEPVTTASDGESGAPPSEDRLSRYRRATWELELLISAAVVFSLFQLPSLLNSLWARIEPTLGERIFMLPFMVYYIGMLTVFALTLAFSVHFVLRSFWVGVCGLRAVFPAGIAWGRYDGSDWSKRMNRRLVMPLGDLERLVDRVASGIFAALFALLLILLMIFFYAGLGLLAVSLVSQFFFPGLNLMVAFYVLMAAFILPSLIVGLAETLAKKKPERVRRWPRFYSFAERLARTAHGSFVGRLYQPIALTFATHLSTKATTRASGISIFVLVGIFLATLVLGSGEIGFDSYQWMPTRSGERSVRHWHYEDQLGSQRGTRLPTIESMVVEGPYLRLFVPFHVNRDRENLQRACPELASLRPEGFFFRREGAGQDEAQAEVLGCLDRIYSVRLDGRSLRDTAGQWFFYRHPERGLEGIALHVDVRDLQRGKHLLTVRRLAFEEDGTLERPQREADESEADFALREARATFQIPFWT
ncbi:MAG: hypothetical protein DWQ36_25995 [Acidobacteria bacterium]|nr:MAG: hypothetical protein DWQ30_17820 [Acidobacteriota bacterium]REJ99464.1 MAG: hypothetical protein DWQ36_25995 [Acidobacteriota bacterium]